MAVSSVAFSNLRAEMARQNIYIEDIAALLGYSRGTMGRKLAREASLSLADAGKIKNAFFPDMDIYYLFNEALIEPTDSPTQTE